MHNTESVLRDCGKEIDDILEATINEPGNELIRTEVAADLAESLNAEKKRTGKDLPVKDTDLYRLAQAMKERNNENERILSVKRAFPRRWSIICDRYNFGWNISCKDMKTTRKKGRPKKTARNQVAEIEGEIKSMQENIKELLDHAEELTEELRKEEK